MEQMSVLIFSATSGAGHVRAAEAVIEALRAKDPNVKITHLDFGAFLSKTFNTVVKNTYIELIKHTPKLWGKFYYRTSKIPPDSVLQRFLNGLGRSEFVKFIQALQNPVARFGFVQNVEELMSAADIIITKAGGLTVSEALTKRVPLVIFRPIPGQEEENAIYLEGIGAGRVAKSEEELEKIILLSVL
ncbi:hypothetical protein JCM15765_16470 [Paradesulfitobacterium aromaticivorans]